MKYTLERLMRCVRDEAFYILPLQITTRDKELLWQVDTIHLKDSRGCEPADITLQQL